MNGGKVDTDRVALLVFVDKKQPEHLLKADQILPKALGNLEVNVIESNPVDHADTRHDPLIGGIGISNANRKFLGTLGAVVMERQSNVRFGLTNWHVIKNTDGKDGDPVVQPAWLPANKNNTIGEVLKWDIALDCAVLELNNSRGHVAVTNLRDIPGVISGMTAPLVGLELTKSRVTTGVIYGVISSVSINDIDVTIMANTAKPATNDEISAPGDSGSVWVTNASVPEAVALHRVGDLDDTPRTEFAYARNIANVAEAMGFEF